MSNSATMCRAQEAFHRQRAEQATLENVRAIAINAALIWAQEAKRAEGIEAKKMLAREQADNDTVASEPSLAEAGLAEAGTD
jgi:hypothetical protein